MKNFLEPILSNESFFTKFNSSKDNFLGDKQKKNHGNVIKTKKVFLSFLVTLMQKQIF